MITNQEMIKLNNLMDSKIEANARHIKKSPETEAELVKIRENCDLHSANSNLINIDIATMKLDMNYIKKKLDEIVSKLGQMSNKVEKINERKASADEFYAIRRKVEDLQSFKWKAIGIAIASSMLIPFIIQSLMKKYE